MMRSARARFMIATLAGLAVLPACDRRPSQLPASGSLTADSAETGAPPTVPNAQPPPVETQTVGETKPSDSAPSSDVERALAATRRFFEFPPKGIEVSPTGVLDLLLAGPEATQAVCAEIDRLRPGANADYVRVLYYVLGFTKDPESIAWVEDKLRSPSRAYILSGWVNGWLHAAPLRYCAVTDRTWDDIAPRWLEVYREILSGPLTPRERVAVTFAMSRWFYSPDAVALFKKIARDPDTGSRSLLIVLAHLRRCGAPVDQEQVQKAVDEVAASEVGWLAAMAAEIGDESFLAPLIAAYRPGTQYGTGLLLQDGLAHVTFAVHCKGRESWVKWFDEHRSESRTQWLEHTTAEIDRLLTVDEAAAKAMLHALVMGCSGDPALVPHIERWLEYPAVRSEVAQLVEPTLDPRYRVRVLTVSRHLTEDQSHPLDEVATLFLRSRCLLGRPSWKDCVMENEGVRQGLYSLSRLAEMYAAYWGKEK